MMLILYFLIIAVICTFCYHFILHHRKFDFLKKKNETGERFASQSKPIIGGSVFFLAICIAYICSTIIGLDTTEYPDYTLLTCCIIAFAMGCIDDLKSFSPMFKLFFQFICALLFILTSNNIATSDNIFLNSALTILWVVGIMNSINMLDNMDGVTASTSFLIFITLALLSQGTDTIILLAIIASLCAFLIWNWHPAKMYMGDNGSQLLGVLLSYFSIKYVWNSADSVIGFNYEQIIFCALIFIVPLIDTTTVAIARFLGGKSPFVGDKYHTTHCLVYKGLSIPKTVLLLDLITVIGCGLSWYYITYEQTQLQTYQVVLLTTFFFCIFLIQFCTNISIRKQNNLLFFHKNE